MLKKVLFVFFVLIILVNQPSVVIAKQEISSSTISCKYYLFHDLVEYLHGKDAKVSAYYENLSTGDSFLYNRGDSYWAASTIKLPLVLYIYQLAINNELSLDEELIYEEDDYFEGSGIIQYDEIGTKYTIRDLVENTIVHSDNIAYIMLVRRVGKENFVNFLIELGGENVYPNGLNITNVHDMTVYLKALVDFRKEHPIMGNTLFSLLEETDYKDTIEAGITDIPVAHKIGYIPIAEVFNEVGIIEDDQPYILIIFTQYIPLDEETKVISDISSIINKYHLKMKGSPKNCNSRFYAQ